MVTIYDAYAEDGDYTYQNASMGAGITAYVSGTSITNYNGGGFRPAYARCGVGMFNNISQPISPVIVRMIPGGPVTSAWFSVRVWCNNAASAESVTPTWGLLDAAGVLRIGMMSTGSNGSAGPFAVFTQNAAGAQTTLFMTTSGFSPSPIAPDKLDVYVNYAAAGSIAFYINGTSVGSFTGNLLTDSATAIAGIQHGPYNNAEFYCQTIYSEGIVADSDTRLLSLQTFYPTGPGTEDQMTGAYTNVDGVTVDDTKYDTTTTSGATQRYAMSTGSNTSGEILALVTALRATQGGGSLGHCALAQLLNGSSQTSAPQPLPAVFGGVQFKQTVNPATGAPFTFTTLTNNYEMGYEALT